MSRDPSLPNSGRNSRNQERSFLRFVRFGGKNAQRKSASGISISGILRLVRNAIIAILPSHKSNRLLRADRSILSVSLLVAEAWRSKGVSLMNPMTIQRTLCFHAIGVIMLNPMNSPRVNFRL